MLRSKSILHPKEEIDGKRIYIMSKHTLNDGITIDERLYGTFDEHMTIFAAPLKIIGAYYKQKISFEEYSKLYLNYLTTIKTEIINLINYAMHNNITVMCIEYSPEKCHRKLFLEYCSTLSNKLEIEIN